MLAQLGTFPCGGCRDFTESLLSVTLNKSHANLFVCVVCAIFVGLSSKMSVGALAYEKNGCFLQRTPTFAVEESASKITKNLGNNNK